MNKKIKIVLVLIVVNIFIGCGFILVRDYYEDTTDLQATKQLSNKYTTTTDNNKSVDFTSLLKRNKDVIGWIYIPDTKIDEPILKGKDNDTYLRTDIDGKHKSSGSIFVDEINSKDFSDINTIIYGHHLRNGTKFTDLEKYMKEDYFNSHKTVYLYTPSDNYTYTVVAASIISQDSALYAKAITANDLILNADICTLEANQDIRHVLMLSTCVKASGADRYVVWAVRNEE